MPAFFQPLLGGALIGLAALLLLGLCGRVAGISGIVDGLVPGRRGDRAWRLAFLAGLWTGGLVLLAWLPAALPTALPAARGTLLVGGLLVGLGAGLSHGCTSGHGVCGLGLRSPRSLVAVLVFMAVAVVTAHLARGGVP
jgi:uncharacterized protein